MAYELVCADVMDWAREYKGEKFMAALLDPPYEYGFMSRKWDAQGVSFRPETWAALAEHLLPGAFLMAFGGSRTFHRMAVAMEDAGLTIGQSLFGWCVGSSFPKSTRIKGHPEWEGHRYGGQMIKDALTPIIVAQKPYDGKPVDSITRTGAGSLWIDGGRVGVGEQLQRPERRGIGNVGGWAKYEQPPGLYGTSPGKGRWPPNLYLQHVSLPVVRLSGIIPSETRDVIRRYYDGYIGVSALREKHRASGPQSEEAEVLQPSVCGCGEKGKAGNQHDGDANVPAMRSGLRVLQGVGEAGSEEVLQLGLQGRTSEDVDGREERPLWDQAHGKDQGENAVETEAEGGRLGTLEGGQERQRERVSVDPQCQPEARDLGASSAHDDERWIHSGTPAGDGDALGQAASEDGACASRERGHTRQQARESNDPRRRYAFSETSRDRAADWGIAGREPEIEVLACDVPEGWRDYFEPTGEDLGCVRVGERRVRGTSLQSSIGKGSGEFSKVYGQAPSVVTSGYADADGMETVAEYRCSPECPVRRLGEQTVNTRTAKASASGMGGWQRETYVGGESLADYRSSRFLDTGTAARFYPNPDWSYEIAERLAGADPVLYQAKASRTERENGLIGHIPCAVCGCYDTETHRDAKGQEHKCRRAIHPTVKPISLCVWLAKLLLPPKEYAPRRVLVPFGGVMSEAIGAMLAGFEEIVAVEMSPEYCEIGEARMQWWLKRIQETGSDEPGAILKSKKNGRLLL